MKTVFVYCKGKFQPTVSSLLLAGGITVSIIAFVFTIKFLCELAARVVSFLQNEDPGRRGDRSIYDYVRGNYLDPRSCKVSWDWKEPQEVGQTMSFRVQVTVNSSCIKAKMFCSSWLLVSWTFIEIRKLTCMSLNLTPLSFFSPAVL